MPLRIGILCPSNIAFRRFLPALKKCPAFSFAGVAVARPEEWAGGRPDPSFLAGERRRASQFVESYGGRIFEGYASLIESSDIDAVYLPLPPALHYSWGRRALLAGRHLLMEKPCTTRPEHTEELIALAKERSLALHENYMFIFHRQIGEICRVITSGEIGDVRLIRTSFGFPFRSAADFRYQKALGGGALLDCGGYPIRLARFLLGSTARLVEGFLAESSTFGVDLFGNATLRNDSGLTAQVAFGMDNAYQCHLEVWGSRGILTADRVFTPPAEMSPELRIQTKDGTKIITVGPDDQFCNSLLIFRDCTEDEKKRQERYEDIRQQSLVIEELRNRGKASCR